MLLVILINNPEDTMTKKLKFGVDGVRGPKRVSAKGGASLKNTAETDTTAAPINSKTNQTGTYFSYSPHATKHSRENQPSQPSTHRLSKSAALLQAAAAKAKHSHRLRTQEFAYRLPRRLLIPIAILIGVIVLVVAGTMNQQRRSDRAERDSQFSAETGVAAPAVLDEQQISSTSLNAYSVASDEPRYLKISKIGVYSRVLKLSVGSGSNTTTLKNIFDIGWLSSSSKPGTPNGNTVLIGHVSGPTRQGALYTVASLEHGDEIIVEKGDGSIVRYLVESVTQYPSDSFDLVKMSEKTKDTKPQLKLITTQGPYNIKTNKFENRIVVYALEKSTD